MDFPSWFGIPTCPPCSLSFIGPRTSIRCTAHAYFRRVLCRTDRVVSKKSQDLFSFLCHYIRIFVSNVCVLDYWVIRIIFFFFFTVYTFIKELFYNFIMITIPGLLIFLGSSFHCSNYCHLCQTCNYKYPLVLLIALQFPTNNK